MDQLQLLDLGGNAFSGGLPAAWGAPDAFPLLVSMDLQGNALTGQYPGQSKHTSPRCRPSPHLLLPVFPRAVWLDESQSGVALPAAAVCAAVGRQKLSKLGALSFGPAICKLCTASGVCVPLLQARCRPPGGSWAPSPCCSGWCWTTISSAAPCHSGERLGDLQPDVMSAGQNCL